MFPGQQQGFASRVSGQDRCRRIAKELPLQFDEKLGVINNQDAKRCAHGVKLCVSVISDSVTRKGNCPVICQHPAPSL